MGGIARRAAIALGSNLGDRAAHLDFAVRRLSSFLDGTVVSRYLETDAVGPVPQPGYLNACVVGATALAARPLLARLLDIEREAGRERPYAWAPRTLDLDLVLHGDSTIEEAGLIVPHPRFRERRFVLEPLAEIAPELIDPVTGLTVAELLRRLGDGCP
jgi:2-amino-4-hydroxy-6-hydroxymethyldihydropteridine diphosphokinase